jgi:hypothetical protein
MQISLEQLLHAVEIYTSYHCDEMLCFESRTVDNRPCRIQVGLPDQTQADLTAHANTLNATR